MAREKHIHTGASVTIRLKSKHFETLNGKLVDGVTISDTRLDFLKKHFKSTMDEIENLDKVYVTRTACSGLAVAKHSLDEPICLLLDLEYVYTKNSYTINIACDNSTTLRKITLRKLPSQPSKCSSWIEEQCLRKSTNGGAEIKISSANGYSFPATPALMYNGMENGAKSLKPGALEMDQELSQRYDEDDLFAFSPGLTNTLNRDCDAESQGTQDSQEVLDEAGIETEMIKESVLDSLSRRTNNTQLLFIRDEIRKLRRDGKWHRFSSKAPSLGNWLLDIFFPN